MELNPIIMLFFIGIVIIASSVFAIVIASNLAEFIIDVLAGITFIVAAIVGVIIITVGSVILCAIGIVTSLLRLIIEKLKLIVCCKNKFRKDKDKK